MAIEIYISTYILKYFLFSVSWYIYSVFLSFLMYLQNAKDAAAAGTTEEQEEEKENRKNHRKTTTFQ